MQKKAKDFLRGLILAAVAVLLLYFCFREVQWNEFLYGLRTCRWWYLLPAAGCAIVIMILRGLRWRMQLLTLDPSTKRITCYNAYAICMVSNMVVPRAGEFIRCAYVSRHSALDREGKKLAPVDKVLGSMVADRLCDTTAGIVLIIITFGVMWDRFGDFLERTVFTRMEGNVALAIIAAAAVAIAVLFIFLCWKFRERGKFWNAVWNFLARAFEGVKSIFHIRSGWLYLLYTALIWTVYWMASFFVMKSIPALDGLGPADALFLTCIGSISSVVPVPGGFGAFHWLVASGITSIYGLPFETTGILFATLSHETNVLTQILLGTEAYIHESLRKK